MNSLLRDTLFNRYDLFFERKSGIECGDGWFMLLDTLMDSIKMYCQQRKKDPIVITQIKEKFGGLRFYHTGGDEYISGLISMTASMSYNICEECGTSLDVGHTKQWISICCSNCHKKNPRRSRLPWVANRDNRLLKLSHIMNNINGRK